MPKCGQFYDATIGEWTQLPAGGFTTEDLTLQSQSGAVGGIATNFKTVKTTDDKLMVFCWNNSGYGDRMKIITILPNGSYTLSSSDYAGGNTALSAIYATSPIVISKDGTMLFWISANHSGDPTGLCSVLVSDLSDSAFTITVEPYPDTATQFCIFKDFYIWIVSGGTVKIYDYTTKTCIDTDGATIIASLAICCSTGNILYSASNGKLQVITFNAGASPITNALSVATIECAGITSATKQMLIDPFGDLIILTNSGTASTLLKYTTAGVLIGTAITLANPSYNLAIQPYDEENPTIFDGSLRYETALVTYKVPNIAGQPLPAKESHILWRNTGNVGYGSNRTGYQPSVYC